MRVVYNEDARRLSRLIHVSTPYGLIIRHSGVLDLAIGPHLFFPLFSKLLNLHRDPYVYLAGRHKSCAMVGSER